MKVIQYFLPLVLGLIVIFILQAVFTPLHFAIVSSGDSPSTSLSIGSRKFNLIRRDLSEKSKIEVLSLDHRSNLNEVQMTPPRFLDGREIKMAPVMMDFVYDKDLGRFVSSKVKASLAFDGEFGDVKIDFLCFQRGGLVQIKRNSHTEEVNLNCPTETWKSVILKSGLSYNHTSRFFFLRDQEISSLNDTFLGDRLVIAVGGKNIYDSTISSISNILIDRWEILFFTINQFQDFLLLSLMTLVLLFVSYSIGDWLVWKFQSQSYLSGEILLKMVLGFFFLAVLSGSLSYFIPTQTQKFIIYLLLLLVFTSRWRANKLDLDIFVSYINQRKLFLSFVVISFYPILYYGARFLGQYHTDIYEYSTLADLIRQKSLINLRGDFESLRSGVVTSGAGFEWRAIDSVFASFVSEVFYMPTRFGFIISAIIFYILYGLMLSDYISRKVNYSKSCEILVTLIASTMVGVIFTYDEGYWSQYYFSCALGILMVLWPNIFLNLQNKTYNFSIEILAFIFTASYALSVYPYFLLPVIAGVVFVFIRDLLKSSKSDFKYLAKICISVALLSNLNLITLYGFFDTKQFFESLDALAVGVVFTPYLDLKGFSLLTGIISWHVRSNYWSQFSEEFPFFLTYLSSFFNFQQSSFVTYTSIFLIVALLVQLLLKSFKKQESKYEAALLKIVFSQALVWSVFILYYYFQNRPYVYFKSLLQLSCLIPIFIVVLFGFTNKSLLTRKVISSLMIGIFFIFQFIGGSFDKISYFSDLSGRSSLLIHVGLIPTLEFQEKTLISSPKSKNFYLAIGDEQMSGTDRDRVLLAHLRSTIRYNQGNCVNCAGIELPITSIKQMGEDCSSFNHEIDAVISIGKSKLNCSGYQSFDMPYVQSSVFTRTQN